MANISKRQAAFSIGNQRRIPTGYQKGNNGIFSLIHPDGLLVRAGGGIVTTSGSQAFQDQAFASYSNDVFNNQFLRFVGNDGTNTSNLTVGEINIVSDFHNTGTLDTDLDWSGSVVVGDQFILSPNNDAWNYVRVSITMAAGTTGLQNASHETLTVTGDVRVKTWVECTTLLAGATAVIRYGVAGDTDFFIGDTTGTDIDANEIWCKVNGGDTGAAYAFAADSIFDAVLLNGTDIGYSIDNTASLSGGVLVFHYHWQPLANASYAVAAAGAAATL